MGRNGQRCIHFITSAVAVMSDAFFGAGPISTTMTRYPLRVSQNASEGPAIPAPLITTVG